MFFFSAGHPDIRRDNQVLQEDPKANEFFMNKMSHNCLFLFIPRGY